MAHLNFLTGGDVAPIRETGMGMFGDVAALFQEADVSFFNLELVLSTEGELARGKATFHRGGPQNIEGLAESGVSCVNIANNHMLDFGDIALLNTIDLLDKKQIGRFGAGRNIAEARKPFVLVKKGLQIGFLGYTPNLPTGFAATSVTPGVNPLQAYTAYQPRKNPLESPGFPPTIITWTDPEHLQQMRQDVAELRKMVDLVIVYAHWGASMSPQVHDFQREIAKAAIDAGAHAVFGGHQHVISGIEFYKGCPIVHSSGNLLFDTWASFFTDETIKTFLFGADIGQDGFKDCYLLPVRNGVKTQPQLLTRHDPLWSAVFDDVAKHSLRFGTSLIACEGSKIRVEPA